MKVGKNGGYGRVCTFAPNGVGTPVCGRAPSLHGLHYSDEGRVRSLMACNDHLHMMLPYCFTNHDVTADCGMPGVVPQWETMPDGRVVSWCMWPDEDPGLWVAMAEPMKTGVLTSSSSTRMRDVLLGSDERLMGNDRS